GQAQAGELHAGDVSQHVGQLVLDQLEGGERPAELLPALDVGQGALVGGDRVPQPLPGDRLAALGQAAAGVGESPRAGQPVVGGNADVVEPDLGLQAGPVGGLAGDDLRLVAGRVPVPAVDYEA